MAPTGAAVALAAALLVGAVANPLPGDTIEDGIFNEDAGVMYMMEDMQWGGPERGCAVAESVGGAELQLDCALPAGRVTLTTDRAASYLAITCESGGGRAGAFECEELQQNAGEALRNHIGEALAQHAGATRVLRSLSVEGCNLTAPLQCLLTLVGAGDVSTVVLRGVPSPLQPSHVIGLSNLTHLRILDVGKNVTKLPYEALAALPALKRLDVHGGALQLAAGGGWRALQQLQMLELTQGELRALPAQAFLGLSQLRNLSLWANRIDTLDENAFEGLSQLECLSLNSNALKVLPRDVLLPTTQLRLLHLYDNRISALPQLGHLKNLEEVWLNNKNKSSLLLHNDTFADLSALRKLKLESCGVQALPAGLLRGCRALVELSLVGNWLLDLPPELFAEQTPLRVLNISRNRLRTLPPRFFSNVRALEELNLSKNKIEVLPNGIFLSLATLNILDLSHNNLSKLNSRVFEGLSGISELSLSYNNLTMEDTSVQWLEVSPLAELKSLTRVWLAHNVVRRFMEDWRDLHHLKFLDLSYNVITKLSDVDLQLLGAALVDVRHNNISRVQLLSIAQLAGGQEQLSQARFQLDSNPYHCDCHMYNFLVALEKPDVARQYDVGRARCAAPPSLANVSLTAAARDALVCAVPVPDCPSSCSCALRPATNSLELNCFAMPQEMPEPSKYGMRAVRLRLRSPLANISLLPATVRLIDLSGLGLVVPPTASGRAADVTVDLSNNSLTSAPLELLEASYTVVLSGNQLACDCEHQQSLAELRRYWARVRDGDALRCSGGELLRQKDVGALCAERDALALGLGSGLAVALLIVLLFRFRTEVRLLLGRFEWFDFLLPKVDEGMLEKKQYDAFVSFSHHDDQYVREVLVPALESGRRPLRLCLHYRNWEVGDLIPDQINRSVQESWRTIVVLSEHFMKSVWTRHEFRAAHGMERVIVLVLGNALDAMDADPELRAYKKTHTCIMASHPLVWDRIRDAVYRSKCAVPPTPPKPACLPTPGGLDVHLHNGQLVNEAATPMPKRGKKFPSLINLAHLNTKYSSQKMVDTKTKPISLVSRWFRFGSTDHNQNCMKSPK